MYKKYGTLYVHIISFVLCGIKLDAWEGTFFVLLACAIGWKNDLIKNAGIVTCSADIGHCFFWVLVPVT